MTVTADEARELIGQPVAYRASRTSPPERGIVDHVGIEGYVYVRFGRDKTPEPVHPTLLTVEAP